MQKRVNTWQNGLLATSALAAIFFAASLLWQQGHAQWAFALAFTAVWALISISWSNVDYAEESGTILAHIVDHNFNQLHERLEEMEKELEILREQATDRHRQAS